MRVRAFYLNIDFLKRPLADFVDQVFDLIDNGQYVEKTVEVRTHTSYELSQHTGDHPTVVFCSPVYPHYRITSGGIVIAAFRRKTPIRIDSHLAIVTENRYWPSTYNVKTMSDISGCLEMSGASVDLPEWYFEPLDDMGYSSSKVEVTPAGDLSDDEQVWLTLQRLA